MATLLVNFADVNGIPRHEKVKVPDLTVTRPIDVIQVIYNLDNSYKPHPGNGGGTTIWKMGKAVVGGSFTDFTDADPLSSNGIIGDDTVELRPAHTDAARTV